MNRGGKNGRMEGWKIGRLEEWKIGRLESWNDGKLEDRKDGFWNIGMMENWNYWNLHLAATLATAGCQLPTANYFCALRFALRAPLFASQHKF
jgi:hypothetical protein